MGIVPTDDLVSLLVQDHEAIEERFSSWTTPMPMSAGSCSGS